MGPANYNNVQKIAVFFPTVTRLALNIFFFFLVVGGTGGGKEREERWTNFKGSRHFGRAAVFLYCFKPFAKVNISEMALPFQFIYLPPLSIDRQIKMNLSRGSMHATSIYSSDSLFLFSLKHNLSFLFKIPSSLSLSLSPSKPSRSPAALLCSRDSAKGQKMEIAHPSGLFSHLKRRA